ncbi:MAG: ribbon-helix-helix domain-containing protein [Propionibacteriaceae bacterium]|jgi:Arc/MetJ-type ribon-helix-helix transcriptional regulator|nr:ribbon-helix-helix domain-containing protein [Propionibacteriaceae bacterium]
MSVQIAVRLEAEDVELLDSLVAEHQAANRSDAIRSMIDKTRREIRYEEESKLMSELLSKGQPVYPEAEDFLAAQQLGGLA